MRTFACAGISAVILMAALAPAPANAADVYGGMGPAVWQGLYLGGHLGLHGDDGASGTFDEEEYKIDGFIGGGQIGYNFQGGRIVAGPEIDFGYLGLDSGKTSAGVTYSSTGGFYADFTGRLGLSLGDTLIYAKGGAAVLDTKVEAKSAGASSAAEGTVWGWTAGAGIERMVTSNLSLKAEYRHFEFNGDDLAVGNRKFSPSSDAATLGANIRLHHSVLPLK